MSLREFEWAMEQDLPAVPKMVLLILADNAIGGESAVPFSYLISRAGVTVDEAWEVFEEIEVRGLGTRLVDDGVPEGDFDVRFVLSVYNLPRTALMPQISSRVQADVPERTRFVYVLRASKNTCKIGISYDVAKRVSFLQRTSGKPLTVVRTFQVPSGQAREVESAAHAHFHTHRVAGEWFDMPPENAVMFLEEITGATA